MTCLICGVLAGSAVALAQDSDADRSHPKTYAKDSAITTKIKSKLAAEHITSLGCIHVDTDTDGVVWLTAAPQPSKKSTRLCPLHATRKASRPSTATLRLRRTAELPDRAGCIDLGRATCRAWRAFCLTRAMGTVTRQLIAQPSITRHCFPATTPDLIRPAAQAASRGGFLDEVFRCIDLIAHHQPLILGAQMRLRPFRIVPAAVAIKIAAGAADKLEQMIDFRLRRRRRCCARHWHEHERQNEARHWKMSVQSLLSSDNHDISSTSNLCQALRAGSRR